MTNIILQNKNRIIMKGIMGEDVVNVFLSYIKDSKKTLFLNESKIQNEIYSKKFNKENIQYMTYSEFFNLKLDKFEDMGIKRVICNDFKRNELNKCREKIHFISENYPNIDVIERICG